MPDALEVVNRIISEHSGIRKHAKLAGDTVNDVEALFTLRRTQSAWDETSVAALVEKKDQLVQALTLLEQGLANHYRFEEESFLPLLGDLLARAIRQEHDDIASEISSARATLTGMDLEEIQERGLLSDTPVIQHSIGSIAQAIAEHTRHEEAILEIMKRALERENPSS